jgi:hypothetical protein
VPVLCVKPGDFTLRSQRSRAVARHILEQRQRSRERLEIIIRRYDADEPRAWPWRDSGKAGKVCRMISIPEGVSLVDGLRVVGGFAASELDQIGQAQPSPINCGSLLTLRR